MVVDCGIFDTAGASFCDVTWFTKLRINQYPSEDCEAVRRSVAFAPGYPYRRESVAPEGYALCGAGGPSRGHAQYRQLVTSRSKGSSRCPTPPRTPPPSIEEKERLEPAAARARASARYSAPPGVYYLVPVRDIDEVERLAMTKRRPSAPLGHFARAERLINNQDHDPREPAIAKEAAGPEDTIQVPVDTAVEDIHVEPPRRPRAIHRKPVHFIAGGPQDEATNAADPRDMESQTQRITRSKLFLARVLPTTKSMLTGVASGSVELLTARKDEGRPWWKPKPALVWSGVVIAKATFAIAFTLSATATKHW